MMMGGRQSMAKCLKNRETKQIYPFAFDFAPVKMNEKWLGKSPTRSSIPWDHGPNNILTQIKKLGALNETAKITTFSWHFL